MPEQPFPPETGKAGLNEQQDLLSVIGDFLEMGYAENIAAMFRKDPGLYAITGDLISDERLMVRLGMAVLFEELAVTRPREILQAVPVLLPLLKAADPALRGEAATLLGIIASPEALAAVTPLLQDPDQQVAEIARDIITEKGFSF